MNEARVRFGDRVINLYAIRDARRDGNKVWLNYIGGGAAVIDGEKADAVWRMVVGVLSDLGPLDGKVTTVGS